MTTLPKNLFNYSFKLRSFCHKRCHFNVSVVNCLRRKRYA